MTGTVKTERKTGLLIHRGLNREIGESNHTYTHIMKELKQTDMS